MKYNGNKKEKKIDSKVFIGIDPGKNGGVAVIDETHNDEPVITFRCPKTPQAMSLSLITSIIRERSFEDVIVVIEHVHAMPKNGVVSMFSFGQNLGQWEGILAAHEFEVEYAGPRTWMQHYDCKPRMDKKDRKRYLRGIAEELFPNIKMTFNISDALLIANYNKEVYYKKMAANARQKS